MIKDSTESKVILVDNILLYYFNDYYKILLLAVTVKKLHSIMHAFASFFYYELARHRTAFSFDSTL